MLSKRVPNYYALPAILISTLLVVIVIYGWTEPSSPPPSGNVSAPLNISTTTQYKGGALGIGGLLRGYSDAIFDGNVGIGTTNPGSAKLNVSGNISIIGSNSGIVFPDGSVQTSAVSGGGWNVYKNDGATLIGRFVSYLGDVSCTSMIYNPSGTSTFSQLDLYNCDGPAYSSEYLFWMDPNCTDFPIGSDVRGPFINNNQYYTCSSNYWKILVKSYRSPNGVCTNWERSVYLYVFCNTYTPAPWICNGGGSGPCIVK